MKQYTLNLNIYPRSGSIELYQRFELDQKSNPRKNTFPECKTSRYFLKLKNRKDDLSSTVRVILQLFIAPLNSFCETYRIEKGSSKYQLSPLKQERPFFSLFVIVEE